MVEFKVQTIYKAMNIGWNCISYSLLLKKIIQKIELNLS